MRLKDSGTWKKHLLIFKDTVMQIQGSSFRVVAEVKRIAQEQLGFLSRMVERAEEKTQASIGPQQENSQSFVYVQRGNGDQCHSPWENYWLDCYPTWNEELEYRVKPGVVHKIGNRYQYEGEDYILACVDSDSKIELISLKCGNGWTNPISVNSIHDISEDEWDRITEGEPFQLLE